MLQSRKKRRLFSSYFLTLRFDIKPTTNDLRKGDVLKKILAVLSRLSWISSLYSYLWPCGVWALTKTRLKYGDCDLKSQNIFFNFKKRYRDKIENIVRRFYVKIQASNFSGHKVPGAEDHSCIFSTYYSTDLLFRSVFWRIFG